MSRVSFCSAPSKTKRSSHETTKHRIPELWQFTDKRFRHETTNITSLPLMFFFLQVICLIPNETAHMWALVSGCFSFCDAKAEFCIS